MTLPTPPDPAALVNDHVWAALVAKGFANELSIPAGNFWEPGIARCLLGHFDMFGSRLDAEDAMRVQLGLVQL